MHKGTGLLLFLIIFVFVSFSLVYVFHEQFIASFFNHNDTVVDIGVTSEDVDVFSKEEKSLVVVEKPIQIVADNLEIPWEIAFLSDGSILVTQRLGSLIRIYPDFESVIDVEGVVQQGEGGLLGMALHPDFETNQWIYLYQTTRSDNGLINRIERYRFDLSNNQLTEEEIILDDIPGAIYHDGGRIEFGPDGFLYVTTGDATDLETAQDVNSLAGKILRIGDDGSIPEDNPFENKVWSYGHRNPQGLAWDNQGRLWVAEHGPSGPQTGFDEVNLIEMGGNFGWPIVQGDENRENMTAPVIHSGSDATWAPADIEVLQDRVLFAGLRGEALYSAEIEANGLVRLRANFQKEYGRIRAVRLGPDGWIYFTTSNTDGRGRALDGDDKLIKVSPDVFFE